MSREEVLTLVREHLAEELEVDAGRIEEGTRFKEDLDADSLDLYELVMELEDTYGVKVSEEQAAKIATVGDAVEFVLEHAPADVSVDALAELIAELPEDLRRQALTHASWTEDRAESYERLAYLGDSVLALAVAADLVERFPEIAAGGLTKIHNQAVSGVACTEVGDALGVPEMLRAGEPADLETAIPAQILLDGERPVPEATEALIGACFLAFGFERLAPAVAAAFAERIEHASEATIDFKSALQEMLARRRARVSYEVTERIRPRPPAPLRGRRRGRRRARRRGRGPQQEGGRAGRGGAGDEAAGRLSGCGRVRPDREPCQATG